MMEDAIPVNSDSVRMINGAKFDNDLANRARELSYSLSYNEDSPQASAKHVLREIYHRLDSRVNRVHKKKDGYLMLTASGNARFMTFKERVAYRIFNVVPMYLK